MPSPSTPVPSQGLSLDVKALVARDDAAASADLASSRLARLIGVGEPHLQFSIEWIAARQGRVRVHVGGDGLTRSDCEWALEPVATLGNRGAPEPPDAEMTVFAVDAEPDTSERRSGHVGFSSGGIDATTSADLPTPTYWSRGSIVAAEDFIAAVLSARARVRVIAIPASPVASADLRSALMAAPPRSVESVGEYVGEPIALRVLIAVPSSTLPVRLKAAIAQAAPHVRFRQLGSAADPGVLKVWESPRDLLQVLPISVAQALLLVPGVHSSSAVRGINVMSPPARVLPRRHQDTSGPKLSLGKSTSTVGQRSVTGLGVTDARRHTQIIGQTGSGKSTAMIAMALSAATTGHGLTFLDPHGNTIDRLLKLLPSTARERTLVVRLADTANPVRASMWSSTTSESVEQVVTDLCDLMRELFDPGSRGVVGPRFERWFALNAKANVALLGRSASFSTIAALAADRDSTVRLARAVKDTDPDTAAALMREYGHLEESSYGEIVSWAASKIERFSSVSALREMFGSGADALNFDTRVSRNDVVLVDLGMPQLGTAPARMAGTLLLQQLWRAITARGVVDEPNNTHFLFLDEAHQFQHGALPRMLAEGRKFGLAIAVAHQHARQLSADVRDALEANAGSLLAFRASAVEAGALATRLGGDLVRELPRLPAMSALASLNVDGAPSSPFTLTFAHPRLEVDAEEYAAEVSARSIRDLVDPYRNAGPITTSEALARLNARSKYARYSNSDFEEKTALLALLHAAPAESSESSA